MASEIIGYVFGIMFLQKSEDFFERSNLEVCLGDAKGKKKLPNHPSAKVAQKETSSDQQERNAYANTVQSVKTDSRDEK